MVAPVRPGEGLFRNPRASGGILKIVMFPKYSPALFLPLLLVPAYASEIQVAGIPNFHEVTAHLYRGGQPTGEGWNRLSKMGVKVVIDLRRQGEHSVGDERRAVEAAGMRYVNVPMKGIVAPENEQISKVLKLFDVSETAPVFVHCRRGADRTGTVIACYRIAHDGWRSERALKEAKSHGMSWMEFGMRHYVRQFHPPTEVASSEGDVLQAAAKP